MFVIIITLLLTLLKKYHFVKNKLVFNTWADKYNISELHKNDNNRWNTIISHTIKNNYLSHTSAKKESENNRHGAQGTVTQLHPVAH